MMTCHNLDEKGPGGGRQVPVGKSRNKCEGKHPHPLNSLASK